MPEVRPYGAWRSPIGPELLTTGAKRFRLPRLDGDAVLWLETRPAESGRVALLRRVAGGPAEEVAPAGANVRSSVHEYGGGAYLADRGIVVAADFADQRLYRVAPGDAPFALTPPSPTSRSLRYADGRLEPGADRMIWVRERHEGSTVANELVRVGLDGATDPEVVASGHDFYACPRYSPDGSRLAFLAWDQPRMPWDGTELYVAEVRPDGSLGVPDLVAGGPEESVLQPSWSPDGALHFVSDRSGWWNLHRLEGDVARNLCPREEEFGTPAWEFGYATYAFLGDGRIVCRRESRGTTPVGILDPASGELIDLDLPFGFVGPWVDAADATVVLVVGGPRRPGAVVALDLRTADVDVVAEGDPLPIDSAYLSEPEAIEFPTEGGRTAYAFFYPPSNPDFVAPEGELPPLVVLSHGGPTGAADTELDLDRHFLTSRGFAVVDVNYGGSTGFGREYRERLRGRWGIVDVEDCAAAANALVARGLADPDRLCASGGSAGGWTTLCLLVFREEFDAGVSYYGVADLTPFVDDTHKFEARYLDSLVGPWPGERDVYVERSPLSHPERIRKPMLVLQGLDDRIVPPAQSEALVAALDANGVPHAYLAFEGEGHGFRRAETIVRGLEAEISFYAQVLGFPHPDDVPFLPLAHLP
ncbi:MAG: prolyl oligopeptidase family serine peptidase [Actinomycetota bacterium]